MRISSTHNTDRDSVPGPSPKHPEYPHPSPPGRRSQLRPELPSKSQQHNNNNKSHQNKKATKDSDALGTPRRPRANAYQDLHVSPPRLGVAALGPSTTPPRSPTATRIPQPIHPSGQPRPTITAPTPTTQRVLSRSSLKRPGMYRYTPSAYILGCSSRNSRPMSA